MTTQYVVFIAIRPYTYPYAIMHDGQPTLQSGEVANAARYTKAEAEETANRWGQFLIANGYHKAARALRIKPATGGQATSYRFASKNN